MIKLCSELGHGDRRFWVVGFESRGDELVVIMFGCGWLDTGMIKLGRGLGHGDGRMLGGYI